MNKNFRYTELDEEFDLVLWGLFFDKLLENLDAYVMVSDRNGRVIFANQRCLSFFNSSSDGLLGKKWPAKIIPRTKRKMAEQIFGQIKKEDILARFDTPVMATANLEKFCHCVMVPLREDDGRLYMLLLKEGTDTARRIIELHSPTEKALSTNYTKIVQALFDASMTADSGTAVHSTRVMSYAVILARKLKLCKESIHKLKVACLLHDLGKIAVDQTILNKNGKLTQEEYEHIKKHPRWSAELVKLIYFLKDVIPIVAAHHENFGGGGYPKGMKGKQIPIESRILSVADIYEALTADRPYRSGYKCEEALRIMEEEKGQKLDPEITDTFVSMVKSGKFREDGFDF